MGVFDALGDLLVVEIETGEVARVGIVAKTDVDGIGAIVDGRLEHRQIAGGTDELHGVWTPEDQAVLTSR